MKEQRYGMSTLKLPVDYKAILIIGDTVDKLIGVLLIIGGLSVLFLAPPGIQIVAALMIIGAFASMFFA